MQNRSLTAVLQREGDLWVALCAELDVTSQGETLQEAKANLKEAVELFLETAGKSEIEERLHTETYVSPLEVTLG